MTESLEAARARADPATCLGSHYKHYHAPRRRMLSVFKTSEDRMFLGKQKIP